MNAGCGWTLGNGHERGGSATDDRRVRGATSGLERQRDGLNKSKHGGFEGSVMHKGEGTGKGGRSSGGVGVEEGSVKVRKKGL